jgi:SAM-dependent methyltransferase
MSREIDTDAKGAYDAIAPYYDDFTANHDFELLFANLLPAIERHGLSGCRLLDVACGTGKSFLPMAKRGWSVVACDISPAMVAVAEKNAADEGVPADLMVTDMRELPRLGQFDLAWCLTDAMNYLLSLKDLVAAFSAMRSNLRPGGMLAFDVNTLRAFQTFFTEEFVVEASGRRMVWRGKGTPDVAPHSISEAVFEVKIDEAAAQPTPCIHRQRHFSESDVVAALKQADLSCVEVFGIHYDAVLRSPLDESQHTKAIYLAKRK